MEYVLIQCNVKIEVELSHEIRKICLGSFRLECRLYVEMIFLVGSQPV